MADRLILHIGPRKTGTTYLQRLLWESESVLEEQGFFLPLADHEAQLHAVATVMGDRWALVGEGDTWEDLAAQVHERPGTALVSSELLGSASPRQIRRLISALDPLPVEVVLGARDVARQLPALWQQWVRAGTTTTYAEWLATARDNPTAPFWKTQDPSVVVDRWSAFVPHDKICVVVVPPHGAPPLQLWERFAEAIGADPSPVDPPSAHANSSFGTVQSELLRRVNAEVAGTFPSRRHQESVVRRHLTGAALLGTPGTRITLPAEHAGWAAARSRQLVDDLAARKVRVVGETDELLIGGQQFPAGAEVTSTELAEEAVRVLARMLHATDRRTARRARRLAELRHRNQELLAQLGQAVAGQRSARWLRRPRWTRPR
jgi:hypothetical protein